MTVEDELLLFVGQFPGRDNRMLPVKVGGPGAEGVELADETGGQVERGPHVGILPQDGGHVHVILGRVQPHPGLGEDARLRVLVVDRLVLVPDEGQVDRLNALLGQRHGRWFGRRPGRGGGRGRDGRRFGRRNRFRGDRLRRGCRRGRRLLAAGDDEAQERDQQDETSHIAMHIVQLHLVAGDGIPRLRSRNAGTHPARQALQEKNHRSRKLHRCPSV